MSQDYSRLQHDPRDDYLGVLLQQGRPLTDADWNVLVAELTRRAQVDSLDTLGPAVVPLQAPDGFLITPTAGGFTIGRGRIYVDGLLAENHGAGAPAWDARLAEPYRPDPVPYDAQPYLPDAPALPDAPYLVYVDVWQREVGPLQDEHLLEKALGGVDTTARLQTVWQVRALGGLAEGTDCATPLDEIPGWAALTAPSAGRLTTATGDVPGDPDPCLVPPAGGYKGGENQLYRVEVHDGGAPGVATFKWSRDNASVQARVLRMPDLTHLVLDSVGRDEVLRFKDGDWIEVLDDVLELAGQPGLLRRIAIGAGVDDATRTVTLAQALPAGQFAVDAQGVPTGDHHLRIRRWDQAGVVRRPDGTAYEDLDAAGSDGAITIPADATQLLLESGVLVSFGVAAAGGTFHSGDWWVFAARSADASLEILAAAPPRGIHHHFAKLAVVSAEGADDCREHWPPDPGCCTVVVRPGESIQAAIESLPPAGGCVCLKAGVHPIENTIRIDRSGIVVHGESPGTTVRAGGLAVLLQVGGGETTVRDVALETIDFEVIAAGLFGSIAISLDGCERVRVHGCAMRFTGKGPGGLVGVAALNGGALDITSNSADRCHVGVLVEGAPTAVRIADNVLRGERASADGAEFPIARYGVRLAGGSALQCCGNDIADFLSGVSVLAGASGVQVADNDIRRLGLPAALDGGQPPASMMFAIEMGADRGRVADNRVDLAAQTYGGLLVTGSHNEICGNRIASSYGQGSVRGPIGAFVGAFRADLVGDGDFTNLSGNHFTGVQLAMSVQRTRGVRIAANTIVASERTGLGIGVNDATETLLAHNHLRELTIALQLGNGADNRVRDNVIARARIGALVDGERALDVSGNRIDDASLLGVGVMGIDVSNRFAHNRIAHCAYGADGLGVGLAAVHLGAAADLTVESCEIVDTGISPDRAQASAGPAVGVAAGAVASVQLANNRIVYEGPARLDPQQEHRAVVLVGTLAYTVALGAGNLELASGGASLTGNVFQGPGRSHLVELRRIPVSPPSIDLRFEKVTFANNRCEHETPIGDQASTVALFGNHMVVSANHVKSSANVRAFQLGNRPRVVLLGNYSTGGYVAVGSTVPAVAADFNVVI